MILIIKRLQYVILLVAGVFILSVYGQPANVVLEDTTFSAAEFIQATNSITAGPNVTVTGSGDLTLEAPSVGLKNTVFVLDGGKLLILSDNTVVNVKSEDQITPKDYVLNQNYPNPFNPTTAISYYVPKESHITG
jgi:hypothetical protein